MVECKLTCRKRRSICTCRAIIILGSKEKDGSYLALFADIADSITRKAAIIPYPTMMRSISAFDICNLSAEQPPAEMFSRHSRPRLPKFLTSAPVEELGVLKLPKSILMPRYTD